jgi:FAD/FMN-containing dehydrogenase
MPDSNLAPRLSQLVGADRVSTDPARLKEAARDLTEIRGTQPDIVVRPATVEHVQAILRFANAEKIPVTPVVANTNVGGLALPSSGGVLLDMGGMNRILEVRPDDLYMVIEPGVSWGMVKEYLDRNYPQLRFAYSLSPPETSVVMNALMDGLLNLSLRYGPSSDWLNGLEAVLPSGEIVRTGAAAFTRAQWCTNSPIPDLTGLFINMHGTTGIVTKASIRLQHNRRLRRRYFTMASDLDSTYAVVKAVLRDEVCDDIGVLTWPLSKMLFGEARPLWRDANEPAAMLYMDVSSNRQREFDLRLEVIEEALAEGRKRGARFEGPLDVRELVRIEPRFQKLAEFPTRLDFLLDHKGGGLSWVGTYGPISKWEEGSRVALAAMEKHGFPPVLVARPMAGGHFGVLRMIETFDRDDPAQVKAVAAVNEAVVEAVLPLGFVPYKTPAWVVEQYRDQIDPGFASLLKGVRSVIDPNGILNPGKWPV